MRKRMGCLAKECDCVAGPHEEIFGAGRGQCDQWSMKEWYWRRHDWYCLEIIYRWKLNGKSEPRN
jgi:hypothetical protein